MSDTPQLNALHSSPCLDSLASQVQALQKDIQDIGYDLRVTKLKARYSYFSRRLGFQNKLLGWFRRFGSNDQLPEYGGDIREDLETINAERLKRMDVQDSSFTDIYRKTEFDDVFGSVYGIDIGAADRALGLEPSLAIFFNLIATVRMKKSLSKSKLELYRSDIEAISWHAIEICMGATTIVSRNELFEESGILWHFAKTAEKVYESMTGVKFCEG